MELNVIQALARWQQLWTLLGVAGPMVLALTLSGVKGWRVLQANSIWDAHPEALDRFFQQWDILLSPVLRAPVFKIGMRDQAKFSFRELDDMLHDYVAYTSLHNICGTTAMSVPVHWDAAGLPLGVQFAARAGAEATLLALARELEEVHPWADKGPTMFSA